jgi:glycosyltransferase involved in cell wall biosynthesis
VHGLNYHAYAAVLAGRWFGKKVIVKIANSGDASDIKKMRREQQLPLENYMLPTALCCDRFVATTDAITKELVAENVKKEHIIQLPNGVETDSIETKREYVFGETIRVTFVGRLHEQKGLDVLFQAFSRVLGKFPSLNIRLQLVGDGPLRKDLLSLAGQLNIGEQVDFMGKRDDAYSFLKATDIFVLPSRAEGMSNALLEAMAFGLPAVVSNIPGNAVLIQQGENGLLFDSENSDSLERCISMYLNDASLRERTGRSARKTIEMRYSLESVADSYVRLYKNLLAEPGL